MNEMITERIPLGDIDNSRADELAKELDRKPSEIEFVRKGFIAEQKGTDDEERSSTELISTAAVDRDNEILLPKGVQLEHYRKNPQVLFGHDYSQPPIGRSAWVKKDKASAGLLAKTIYATTVFAEEIWGLVKGGFLPARSVGFIPIESHEPDERELARHPEYAGARRIYDKWELLEYSVVPVPSNREALQLAVGKGLGLSTKLQQQLGLDEEIAAEPEQTPEDKQPTLISVPNGVKEVILMPSVLRVVRLPKKRLDIRRQVVMVVNQEMNRLRGRI